MAISLADANLLRGRKHVITDLVLNAVPLVEVASAQVNQSVFSYPITQLAVDNTSAGWTTAVKRGMRYSIGTTPGGSDITVGAVKAVPGANTFYLAARSLGDPGYARDIIQGLTNDLYITVYADRPLWQHFSAIRNKVFYKDFDTAYSNQGSAPNPIAMFGTHRQVFVDEETGTAELAFTATPVVFGSATITGHQFACATASVVAGSATTANVTYEFEPGFHVVEYTATTSQSKTHTAYRYVWVNERTGENAPFGRLHEWEITSDSEDENGRRVGIKLTGNFTPEDIYPGQAFLLTEYATFDGQTLANESDRTSAFFGYVAERSIDRTRTAPSMDITLESPLVYARRIGNASQLITEKASPANWTQVTSALSHPPGAAWYLMHWHCPNLLAGHDFSFPTGLKDLRRLSFEFSEGTLGGQLDQLKELMLGNIGSLSDGTTVLCQSGNYMSNTNRNLLDVKFTWDEFDLQPPLSYPYTFAMPTAYVKGGAFSYNGGALPTPYLSRAPGNVQAQGSQTAEKNFIVTTSEGQDRVNAITGHLFAEQAAPTASFSITGNRNIDICEPQRVNVWHRVNIPARLDPAGEGWNNKRVLPIRVSRSYRKSERGSILKSVQVEFKPETFGQPGITVPIERGGGQNQLTPGGFNIQQPVYYDPKVDNAFALVWTYDGRLARSHNFNSTTPHYEKIDLMLSGSVNDVTVNYGSDYFQTGTGALGAWVVTTEDATLRIYYAQDVRTSDPAWQEQAEYTMSDNTVEHSAQIESSKTTTTFVIAAWRNQSGTKVVRTENAGVDWDETPIVVGDLVSDTANYDAPIGLCVDGVVQIVTAPNSSLEYHLYKADTVDGTFAVIDGSPASTAPHPFITADGQGNLYTATVDPGIPEAVNITFDDGGTEWDTGISLVGTVAGGGISGNSLQTTITTTGLHTLTVTQAVIFPVPTTVTGIEFDLRQDFTDGNLGTGTNETAQAEIAQYAGYDAPEGDALDDLTDTPSWSPGTVQDYHFNYEHTIEGVRRVTFRWSRNITGGSPNYTVFMDNCQVFLE